MNQRYVLFLLLMIPVAQAMAEVRVITEVNRAESATPEFRFKGIMSPTVTDVGGLAKVKVALGIRDPKGGSVACLTDGRLPRNEDDPANNFFFSGDRGGRLLFDLGEARDLQQINTFSWHPDVRGSQVYHLYAAPDTSVIGDLENFNPASADSIWIHLADVDTRENGTPRGGQYGVSVQDSDGADLGRYRYLLFSVETTATKRRFSQTFFSEIEVIDGDEHSAPEIAEVIEKLTIGADYEITFDMTELPEIQDWVNETLKPVCEKWYPKIVELFPSDGFIAPKQFTIYFHRDMQGVAYADGRNIHCAGNWFLKNLAGEAAGSIVHEMTHIVQQYRPRRDQKPNPGWLVEGVADYVRWYLYEPVTKRRTINLDRSNYDDSYQTTGAFLNYLVDTEDPLFVTKINSAMRQGKYDQSIWNDMLGAAPDELWSEFVKAQKR